MKNALFVIGLFCIPFLTFAQETKTISFEQADLAKSDFKISKNWTSTIQDKSLTISNGNISNKSNGNSGKLKLEYYLFNSPLNFSSNSINGFLIAETPIRSINRNASSVGVIIKNTVRDLPPQGIYYPVLALSNSNGQILDLIQLSDLIVIENESMAKKQTEIPKKENESKTDMSAVTDLNKPIKLNVDLDNSISLEKEWKINIDFKNFMINLNGGDIANNTATDSKKLILDVYLSKGEPAFTSDFQGIHIAKAPLNPIKKSKRTVGTSIKTNLRAIPPQGTYHIIMTLSEVDDSGKAIVKNTKSFQNAVTL